MENLQHLTDDEKRKWLVEELKQKWYLDQDDIIDGDCKDDAIVCGNTNIDFITILKILNQLDWIGFEIGDMELFIDIKIARKLIRGISDLPTCDEFSIIDGIIRIWYD